MQDQTKKIVGPMHCTYWVILYNFSYPTNDSYNIKYTQYII